MTNTALVVVDLVKDFTMPGGAIYYETTGNMMNTVCAFIDFMRAHGVQIIYIQNIADANRAEKKHVKTRASCVAGSGGELLDERLSRFPEDIVVVKHRFSAFFNTELEQVLKTKSVEKIVIIGTKTNCCVRATAIDANMRDFDTYIVGDCVSTNTEELNKFHLEDLGKYTAHVMTSQEIEQLIDRKRW